MPAERHGESDTRSKRKQPPTPSNERPLKQIKPEASHARNGTYAAASPEPLTREQTPTPSMDMAMDDLPPAAHIAGAIHDTAEWQKTIETVVKSVVSIHFCQTCSFDTDPAIASEATGFVVDAERGYILTNRVRDGILNTLRPKALT
jgi:S1-C subfamily serine protease